LIMSDTPKHRLRFAPSPNGYLHLGHAYSALQNEKVARELGGELLVRIEDIDIERCRKSFEEALFEDLAWLGIEWQPPARRQSEHFADYSNALDGLRERGLLYPCFCTRSDVTRVVGGARDWPRDPDGTPLYPGTCRHMSEEERVHRLNAGQNAALRINMDEAMGLAGMRLGWCEFGEGDAPRDVSAEPALWGDAVIGRKDIPASYHIAVVVDDALQGITDVVRGQDLFDATSLHRLLQALLDLDAPHYHHHTLLRDSSGDKLSKSARAKSLRSLRAEGFTPQDVRRRLGFS
jgi:glutamyl-Q tRNA(Asp) synthetase